MTDGAVHSMFGLSYANYFVMPRTVLQSMPLDWQERFVAVIDELEAVAAKHSITTPQYKVEAAVESEYWELDLVDLARLEITRDWVCADECAFEDCDQDCDGDFVYYDADSRERQPYERVLISTGQDPLADYERGRRRLW